MAQLERVKTPKTSADISRTHRGLSLPSEDKNHEAGLPSDPETADLQRMLSEMPDEQRHIVMEMLSYQFSGPLPHPEMLGRYEEVLPGAADRILSLAEKEQEMRGRDNRAILGNDRLRISGSIGVSGLLVVAGVFCGWIGQPWLGAALGGSGVVGVVVRAFNQKNSD